MTRIVAALDAGSTKICCFIARIDDDGDIDVLGIGDRASRGIVEGTVTDMRTATAAIAETIQQAERMADEEVREIHVATSGGRPESQRIRFDLPVSGPKITRMDIRRIQHAGWARIRTEGRRLLFAQPLAYSVDDTEGIRNPEGMYGGRLGIDLHAVTAESGPVRNLEACIEEADASVASVLPSPYASGLALVGEEDRELGVTVLDMGGGTTGIGVFTKDGPSFIDVMGKGGSRVTADIAFAFSLGFRQAEELKTREANCLNGSVEGAIPIPFPGDGEAGEELGIDRSYLAQVVTPRIEETFERARARLDETGAAVEAGRRVLLTGGASQLLGIAGPGELLMGRKLRNGRLDTGIRIAEARSGPAYAACAGVLVHAAQDGRILPPDAPVLAGLTDGPLDRIGAWIRRFL